jgi:hypothetical protein
MRFVTLLCLFAASASATPAAPPRSPSVNLVPIVVAELPQTCRAVGKQTQNPTLAVALQARISLAGCLADDAIDKLDLIDAGESIVALDAATERSVELLDEVAAAGDPASAILAHAARGDLYVTLRIRMLSTIAAPDPTPESIALHDARQQFLELQLEPWQAQARRAFERVVELAKANPALAKNPLVQTAVRASQQRLATTVATST